MAATCLHSFPPASHAISRARPSVHASVHHTRVSRHAKSIHLLECVSVRQSATMSKPPAPASHPTQVTPAADPSPSPPYKTAPSPPRPQFIRRSFHFKPPLPPPPVHRCLSPPDPRGPVWIMRPASSAGAGGGSVLARSACRSSGANQRWPSAAVAVGRSRGDFSNSLHSRSCRGAGKRQGWRQAGEGLACFCACVLECWVLAVAAVARHTSRYSCAQRRQSP